ncbi:Ku protein [Streptomyces clavuligerus]|uniref:Non-homologous end joining protein Ku n=3 Tax=Streptomyces clavuligerus TaxID=1901 RepID=B2LX19_STRCL|nr:Ku protein [Streptomyces clavuligerus]ACB72859.1 putative ku70/ku80 protein [Streptomyces clavuligerus]ANW18160.1 Ku protein [Streptomyces clavuligerus]AXU12721.1 Ku protein [Streptomyces clavuligerus]EDY47148.1 Ku70/Ku80 protein [Streptomyces clavuligerus]EFG09244.1 putative Ku70/Ku80 protein [Streptomyces clavuligerus]
MRSIWNGAISFGLVSIPIKLVNATESHSISFRQIHTADGGRIRYRKVCELDEKEVPAAEIGKGYEEADGSIVPITDEDLARLPLPTAKTIEIVAFVPASEIDPLQMDAAYYLSADGVPAAKPYTLLREALKRSRKVALAKYALRGRERLGMLRVVDDVIAMHGLLWPDEIRRPEGVAPQTEVTVRDAELDLADALMDTLGEVDMDSLHDDYREAVEAMIAAKSDGGAALPGAEGDEGRGGQVIDLMAALENSVKAARKARSGGAEGEELAGVTRLETRKRAPARKAPTGRAPAGKPAAPAQKTAQKTAKKVPTEVAAKAAKKASAPARKSAAAKGTATKATAGRKAAPAKKSAPRKRASA